MFNPTLDSAVLAPGYAKCQAFLRVLAFAGMCPGQWKHISFLGETPSNLPGCFKHHASALCPHPQQQEGRGPPALYFLCPLCPAQSGQGIFPGRLPSFLKGIRSRLPPPQNTHTSLIPLEQQPLKYGMKTPWGSETLSEGS